MDGAPGGTVVAREELVTSVLKSRTPPFHSLYRRSEKCNNVRMYLERFIKIYSMLSKH